MSIYCYREGLQLVCVCVFLLQVVLDLCRAEQITDMDAIEMHLERIKDLVSTWAAQVCFLKSDIKCCRFTLKQI